MSQFYINSNGGGGGGGDVNSLTPDVGAPVTAVDGTIPVLGYKADTVPTLQTYNDGAGNFRIADQTWYTQYVVDPSDTPGLMGTFDTIQAALDQAVADGMDNLDFRTIYIRAGTYTENLVIPGGAILVGENLSLPSGGVATPFGGITTINGNHTFAATNAFCGFNNLNFTASSGDIFSLGAATTTLLYFNNCVLFLGESATSIVNITADSFYCSFNGCTFGGSNQTAFNIGGGLNISNCVFAQHVGISITGGLTINNSIAIGPVVLGSGSNIGAIGSSFVAGGDANIDGTESGTSGSIIGCSFSGATIGVAISSGIGWQIQNSACSGLSNTTASPSTILYNNTPLAVTGSNTYGNSTQGNLIRSITTDVSLDIQPGMYYLGITDTSVARTVTLPDTTSSAPPQIDQVFIIKDESGGATTNNITVTTASGTTLIDGATTYVINTNYGFIEVLYNGTNYHIITESASASTSLSTANTTVQVVSNVMDFGGDNLGLGSPYNHITSGNFNTSIGHQANDALTSGSENTALGSFANLAATTGSQNTAMGSVALESAYTTSNNTAVGFAALQEYAGTSGAGANTAIGASALSTAGFTGNQNIAIGYQSGTAYTSTESNNLLVGSAGVVGESNVTRIGTQGTGAGEQSKCFVAGIEGVTVASSSVVGVNSSGQLSSLGTGSSGQVLTSTGTTSPTWQSPASPTLTTATSFVAKGSGVSLTSATPANITSLSLAAGTWLVSGLVQFSMTGSLAVGGVIASISTTTATNGTLGNNSASINATPTTSDMGVTVPPYIITLASAGTAFLVGTANYSGGTTTGYGSITALKVA